jgi:protein-L-isoaspartate(D-aspartate) O-methyltransferase
MTITVVNRADFLPEELKHFADCEFPVPLDVNLTVPTKSYTEFVINLLELKPEDVVLEIGTGSGYQTACLAAVCTVVSCDIRPVPGNLGEILPPNVYLHGSRDGRTPPAGEYDAILVTCGVDRVFPAWKEYLKVGGRMIVPIGTGPEYELTKWVKDPELRMVGSCAYLPMVPIQ